MNSFFNANKNLFTYSIIFLILIPIFGINFLLTFIGNILILIILIPLLLALIIFIGFNYFKSKLKTCYSCGTISFGQDTKCTNCGSELDNFNNDQQTEKAGDKTIEIKAEEIK